MVCCQKENTYDVRFMQKCISDVESNGGGNGICFGRCWNKNLGL